MSVFADMKAEVRRSARGKSSVTIKVSELCEMMDALQQRDDSWRADIEAAKAQIAKRDDRIRQLEANLEAAQRRSARVRA